MKNYPISESLSIVLHSHKYRLHLDTGVCHLITRLRIDNHFLRRQADRGILYLINFNGSTCKVLEDWIFSIFQYLIIRKFTSFQFGSVRQDVIYSGEEDSGRLLGLSLSDFLLIETRTIILRNLYKFFYKECPSTYSSLVACPVFGNRSKE